MSTIPEDFSVKSRRNNELPTNLAQSSSGRKPDPNLCGNESYDLSTKHSPAEATDLRFNGFAQTDSKRAGTPQTYRNADPFLGNGNHKPQESFSGSNNNNHHNSNGSSEKSPPLGHREFGLLSQESKFQPNGSESQSIGQHPFINHIGSETGTASASKSGSPSFSSFLQDQENHIGIPLSNGMSSTSAASDTDNPTNSMYGESVYIKEENRNPLSPESMSDISSVNQPHATRSSTVTTMTTYQSSPSPSLDYTMSSSAFRPTQSSSSLNYYHNQIGGSSPYAGSPVGAYKRMNSASSRVAEPHPSPDSVSRSDSRPGSSALPQSLAITDTLAAAASGITSQPFIASSMSPSYYPGISRSSTERTNTPSGTMIPYSATYQPADVGSSSVAKSGNTTNPLNPYGPAGGYSEGPPPLVQTPDGSQPANSGNSNEPEPLKRVIVPAG